MQTPQISLPVHESMLLGTVAASGVMLFNHPVPKDLPKGVVYYNE